MYNRDGPEYVLSHRVSVFHDHLTSSVDNSIIIKQISKAEKKSVGELLNAGKIFQNKTNNQEVMLPENLYNEYL